MAARATDLSPDTGHTTHSLASAAIMDALQQGADQRTSPVTTATAGL